MYAIDKFVILYKPFIEIGTSLNLGPYDGVCMFGPVRQHVRRTTEVNNICYMFNIPILSASLNRVGCAQGES